MSQIQPERLREQYWAAMEEVKVRLDVLSNVLKGKYDIPLFSQFELCHLQIRMTCELLALACLVGHGDMPNVRTKIIQGAYEPHKIIRHLEALHPAFFPIPVEEINDSEGVLGGIKPTNNGALTKYELIKLHGSCSNALHQGNITNFQSTIAWDRIETAKWHNKIMRLMKCHIMLMSDRKRVIFVRIQATRPTRLLDLELSDSSHWPSFYEDMLK